MKGEDKITTRSCIVEIKKGIQSYGNALKVVPETKDSTMSMGESEIYWKFTLNTETSGCGSVSL